MAIKASSEAIRGISSNLKSMASEITSMNSDLKSGLSGVTSSWNDSKSEEFLSIMNGLASSMNAPLEAINQSIPKLEKMADSLDEYQNTKF